MQHGLRVVSSLSSAPALPPVSRGTFKLPPLLGFHSPHVHKDILSLGFINEAASSVPAQLEPQI